MVGTGWPTLSELRATDFGYFTVLANYLRTIGPKAESALEQLADAVKYPGGVEWRGAAGDAAIGQAATDLLRARPVLGSWHDVATAAPHWQQILEAGKHLALDAVGDAERDGFSVGDDYSVADTRECTTEAEYEARLRVARAHFSFIRHRVSTLVANERDINTNLAAMTAEWGQLTFSEHGGGVRAVDFKQGGGPADELPYPVNNVIAEATDLDGNRIILRRGYYDATAKRGWGWDKAYWKHGVVNPNVFKDLISHSRPIHLPDGTLRYDVTINRTHCTSGLLGITSCEDTGESLTMRIVVDPNEGRAGVPDGRQKGVITMFPLEGGSGVIKLGNDWTWTPPWVNTNVPIN
ncbi:hypothetical protein MSAS_45290 [Mycobacterium saskatchewanense]|uniref:Uncharacterized protein n=1 Tax=Mycobacterium saskatchewanense TaxID=220927 RepID=A0A1X2CFM6_9MYCO|nr:hypothetical protein [Mycobacterium saskatchewanense]ORW74652.1 hypothetical protein AWC23_04530 [Mycobacterium saskatchewanense]BBX65355.1 hypothetical protein MSAS_45290 [Mycobacterium saskatchewanense]